MDKAGGLFRIRGGLGRWLVSAGLLLMVAGCASGPPRAPAGLEPGRADGLLQEDVAAAGAFREHVLARCRQEAPVPAVVERYLGTCSEYFRGGSGADGMMELEFGLQQGNRHPLLLLTLGELYLLAGQGNPDLLPSEGPAADLGDYRRNKPRLLGRAGRLLAEAARRRPDDAAITYLRADVARASGEIARADSLVIRAHGQCTGGRSFRILQLYQELYQHAPRYLGGPAPEYPAAAASKGLGGDVVLDLLLSPAGEVRQYEVVQSPSDLLTGAAWGSLQHGHFVAGSVGKYAVWTWLRVTTAFNLDR